MSGKERALNSKKDGVEATEVGRRKEPCRVEVENEGRKVWLHLSTTGGAPFKSVTLSREAAEKLSGILAENSGVQKHSNTFLKKVAAVFLTAIVAFAGGLSVSSTKRSADTVQRVVRGNEEVEKTAAEESPQPSLEKAQAPPVVEEPVEISIPSEVKSVFSYLARPSFSGTDFEKQILGDWRLEKIYVDTYEVYLSHPGVAPKSRFSELFHDSQQVEVAEFQNGIYKFGDDSFGGKEVGTLVRTQAANIDIPKDKILQIPYTAASYEISLAEVDDFLENKSTYYKGLRSFEIPGTNSSVSNHGAFVAETGEASLTRFASQLTLGRNGREEKIQALLDFVTQEIAYNDSEALAEYETLKRPNEVLFTRTSDCSGKTILLASLLEQLHEPYYLVYLSKHIAVMVKKGSFSAENGYELKIRGEDFVLAECTATGFKIGSTFLEQGFITSEIRFFQDPKDNVVIDELGNGIQ